MEWSIVGFPWQVHFLLSHLSPCHQSADGHRARGAPGGAGGGGQHDPADMLSWSREPDAAPGGDAPQGRKARKGPSQDSKGAPGEAVDMMSMIRPDPNAELLGSGVHCLPFLTQIHLPFLVGLITKTIACSLLERVIVFKPIYHFHEFSSQMEKKKVPKPKNIEICSTNASHIL